MTSHGLLAHSALAVLVVACLNAPALAQSTTSNSPAAPDGSNLTSASGVREVIVTARKRAEREIDVPAAVSSVSAAQLELLNINSLADLANFVPGLSVVSGGVPGNRTISIRGVSTGTNQTTGSLVATYIDDMPVGASTGGVRSGIYSVDLSPDDIQDIEVLKGPQGTLYGANAMGGLIKYTLISPNLTRPEADISANTEYVANSGSPSWGLHAAGGAPLIEDKLAFRISGFYKDNAGYLDNVGLGIKDANSSDEFGGILSVLWRPLATLSIHATILAQDIESDGYSAVNVNPTTQQPTYGRYDFSTNVTEPYSQKTREYGLGADWDLKFATITDTTSYSTLDTSESMDLSNYGAYCAPGALGPKSLGCPDYPYPTAHAKFILSPLSVNKFTQELRVTSPMDQALQWVLGGFYTDERSAEGQSFPTYTSTNVPLPLADNLYILNSTGTYDEEAVFGELSYRPNRYFDIGGGLRYSNYSQSINNSALTGILGGTPAKSTSLPNQGVLLWTFDPRFHINNNAMIYGRIATGYRPGSGCSTCGIPALGIPGIVQHDSTTNYELGLKGNFLERRLQTDLSVFYIDWKDIQINAVSSGGINYATNGGRAKSEGVEFTSGYDLMQGLKASVNLAYTDAKTLDAIPSLSAKAGDQLPDSARWSGAVALDFARPLPGNSIVLLAGGNFHFRSNEYYAFQSAKQPYALGDLDAADLYIGASHGGFTYKLFATNFTNSRNYIGVYYISPARYVPLQPATVGISIKKEFF